MAEVSPSVTALALSSPAESLLTVYHARLADVEDYNHELADAFLELADDPETRHSHFFHGRYENIYPPRERLPAIESLIATVERTAREILKTEEPLRIGFWLNRMGPGQLTTLHTHEDLYEMLSAVYYLAVPPDSGRLIFRTGVATLSINPEPGMLLLFPPHLAHEVETHRGENLRLSVAFNIGPATDP